MPRGFLVKRRTKHRPTFTHRAASVSDDDRSDSGSDHDHRSSQRSSLWSPEPLHAQPAWCPDVTQGHTADTEREKKMRSPDSARSQQLQWLSTQLSPSRKRGADPPRYDTCPIRVPLFRSGDSGVLSDRDSPRSRDSRSPVSTASSSPHPLSIHPYFLTGSPLYYINGFDKLSVQSPNRASTPGSIGSSSPSLSSPSKRRLSADNKPKTPKKSRAVRKLDFEGDTSSPVSGTIITKDDGKKEMKFEKCVDIDSSLNVVIITDEAKAELAKINNKIGEYVCQLCKEKYEDAFQLAQHRCSRIIYIEYRCPECDKLFNCPANLASHRRWHKPRNNQARVNNNMGEAGSAVTSPSAVNDNDNNSSSNGSANLSDGNHNPTVVSRYNPEENYHCNTCGKKFKRQAYLRKHVMAHVEKTGGRPQQCQHCGQMFLNMEDKLQHIIDFHPSVTVKKHCCSFCGSSFASTPELDKHIRIHTTEVFPCKFCDTSFFTSPALTRHVGKCHPTENRQVIMMELPPI